MIKTELRPFKKTLTEAELLELNREMITRTQDLKKAEVKKREAIMAARKAFEEEKDTLVIISNKIANGYENVQLECYVEMNLPEHGIKTITWIVSGESFTEEMSTEEIDASAIKEDSPTDQDTDQ